MRFLLPAAAVASSASVCNDELDSAAVDVVSIDRRSHRASGYGTPVTLHASAQAESCLECERNFPQRHRGFTSNAPDLHYLAPPL